jgi:hypothetical protein
MTVGTEKHEYETITATTFFVLGKDSVGLLGQKSMNLRFLDQRRSILTPRFRKHREASKEIKT